MAASDAIRIAQISDLHCGGPYFEASLLERAIVLHARGEIRVLGGRAIVAGALGPEEMDPIARTAATPIGRAAGGGIR